MKLRLEDALQSSRLPREALTQIREGVQLEWHTVVNTARRARQWRVAGLAAAVLLAAVGLILNMQRPPNGPEFGVVLRAGPGGLADRSGFFSELPVHAGAKLYVGQSILARSPALIGLNGGGSIRVAPDSQFKVRGEQTVALNHGMMYVEFSPGRAGNSFIVETNAGSVQHLGTQFEVISLDDGVRVRVREGRIRFTGISGPIIAKAGVELDVSRDGAVAQKPVETHGRDWAWVESLAPDFVLERQHLVDFLRWVGRETGRNIEFADPHVQSLAEATELHGSVVGMTPMEALTSVFSTTSLRFQLQDHSIRVVSGE